MARIRSVHPGFFDDEVLGALSEAAALLLIGLNTQSDDRGIFVWNPARLRIRLRPLKDGSIEPLLAELAGVDVIRMYEIDGVKLGAIRKFCVHQAPRFPKFVHPTTADIRSYVGSTDDITEKPPPQAPHVTAKRRKRRPDGDGDGEGEGVSEPDGSSRERSPAARGTRLDAGWVLPSEWADWASTEGLDQPQREAERFRDHWIAQPGAKGLKTNWEATWRNWVRRAIEHAGSRQPQPRANGAGADGHAAFRTGLARAAVAGVGPGQPDLPADDAGPGPGRLV